MMGSSKAVRHEEKSMKLIGVLRRSLRRAVLVGVLPVAVAAVLLPAVSEASGVTPVAQSSDQPNNPTIIGWQ
jgi:hypothetical protein